MSRRTVVRHFVTHADKISNIGFEPKPFAQYVDVILMASTRCCPCFEWFEPLLALLTPAGGSMAFNVSLFVRVR